MSKEQTAIEFYNSVSKTNPNYVKRAKVSGRNITAVDPQRQTESATKAFGGLYGDTWGIKDISFTTRNYDTTEVMTLKGVFYYPDGDFEYAVSDKSYYVSQKGFPMIDTDIEKKLLTSFKSKCLSLLGFNSDIFVGLYDDVNYVNDVAMEYTLITQQQLTEITKLLSATKTEAKAFNGNFGISKTSELPQSEYNKAMALLNAKVKKMEKGNADNKQP